MSHQPALLAAAALATASPAMLPDAPERLSTTTVWPSTPRSPSASTRAVISVLPPGAKGTSRRIGRVRPEVLSSLISAGFIPVIAPLGADAAGRSLNVNADTAAGALAAAMKAEKFLLMTDTAGVCDA